MCEKCRKAAKVLEAILPYQDGCDKLRQWAVESQSEEKVRMVAAYIILTDCDRYKDVSSHCSICGKKVFWDKKENKIVCTDETGNVMAGRCFEKIVPSKIID